VGEVKHLKQALKGRDVEVQELRDRLREYELSEGGERTAQEAVLQAQGGAAQLLRC
jgi:inosine/xanthosine triphosphate pyrophosphatase family protein